MFPSNIGCQRLNNVVIVEFGCHLRHKALASNSMCGAEKVGGSVLF